MAAKKGQDTISVTDNRTGKTYDSPIADGTIKATDLRTIKVDDDDFGLMTYDPAFMNTASCKSAITFIDGDVGILRYRGYPIDQLAEKSTFTGLPSCTMMMSDGGDGTLSSANSDTHVWM